MSTGEIGKKSVKHPGSENLTPGGPGRPKGRKNFATLYRQAIEKIALSEGMEPDAFELEIVKQALKKARNGDIAFYRDTMDRVHGKAQQNVDHTTNGKELPQPIVQINALRANNSDQ